MRVLKYCAVAIFWLGLCVEVSAQHVRSMQGPLYGVDMIPPDAIQITREQMRRLFVVSDSYSASADVSVDRVMSHNEGMRLDACLASVMHCGDHNDFKTTPFAFLAKYPFLQSERDVTEWVVREAMKMGSQIVTESKTTIHGIEGGIADVYSSSLPFVLEAIS